MHTCQIYLNILHMQTNILWPVATAPWGISYQQKTRTSQVTGNQRLEMCQGVRRNRSDSDEGKQRSKKATGKRKTSRIWDALSTSICLSKGTSGLEVCFLFSCVWHYFCLAYWKGKSYSKPPHFLGFMLTFQGVGVFLTVGP